jgi:hypothetical protein
MAIGLALTVASAITGCNQDSDKNIPVKRQHALLEFCGPLVDFLKTELRIPGAGYLPGSASYTVTEKGNYCVINSRTAISGVAWITPLRDGKPGLAPESREQAGYKTLPGHSPEVWVSDRRLTGPERINGGLEITTDVGEWNGSIEIINGAEPLTITDEQVGNLAELLIRVTRKIGE